MVDDVDTDALWHYLAFEPICYLSLQMFPLETVELPDQWEQLVQWAADSLNRAEQRHGWTWEPEAVAVQAAS